MSAVAQTVQVQSGEHPGFSRLVIDIGADRDWDMEQRGSDAAISFSPAVDGFDMDRVFDLIPRIRLADLRGEDGTLILDLACACPVSATRYTDRYLVLDIADASVTEGQATGSVQNTDVDAARRLAAAESLPNLLDVISAPPAQDAQAPAAAAPGDPVALQDAADIMAEQLARAAATGLLEAAGGRPMSDADPMRIDPSELANLPEEARIETAGQSAPHSLSDIPFNLPLRAETAIDTALQRTPNAEAQRPRLACTGEELALSDWADGAGVAHGLGQLRAALYDDRDQPVDAAAKSLAQHYLYYGFGAEAEYWLSQMPAPPDDLVALAQLVDGAGSSVFPRLSDTSTCSESELLWRYIDDPDPADLTDGQVAALQRAAAALPSVLRAQIAPELSRTLSIAGHDNAARNIRDMLARGGLVPTPVMMRLDIDLGIPVADSASDTRAALALALRDDGSDAPSAMAYALRFDREAGVMVSLTRIDAAEALLREVGLDTQTADLWHELLLAHADAGHIGRMMDLLEGPYPSNDERDSVLTAVFQNRLQAEDAATLLLLAHAHGESWAAQGSEAGRARVALIAFLRERGFPAAAERVRGAQRMLILPARPTPVADARDAARDAWLTEDWLQLEGLVEGPHEDLAARMQTGADTSSATDRGPRPDLDRLSATLLDTAVLRQTVSAVLSDPTPRFRAE